MAHTNLEAFAEIAERLGLSIPAIHRPSVAYNLELLLDQAQLVMAAPLPDRLEPPGEFQP